MIVTAAQILADIGDEDLEDPADDGLVWLALHGYLHPRELPEPERRAVRREKQRRRRADIRPRKAAAV